MVYEGKTRLEMDDLGVPLFQDTTICWIFLDDDFFKSHESQAAGSWQAWCLEATWVLNPKLGFESSVSSCLVISEKILDKQLEVSYSHGGNHKSI